MGLIQPIGMRPTQSVSQGKPNTTLSSEVMDILKNMGIRSIHAIRIQQGISATIALKEMTTLKLSHDQKNALQGLGLEGILVAIFSEDDDINSNYKDKLDELHEHLLGKETINLLKDAFGLSNTPILMEDDHHNGVFLLQQSITQIQEGL